MEESWSGKDEKQNILVQENKDRLKEYPSEFLNGTLGASRARPLSRSTLEAYFYNLATANFLKVCC